MNGLSLIVVSQHLPSPSLSLSSFSFFCISLLHIKQTNKHFLLSFKQRTVRSKLSIEASSLKKLYFVTPQPKMQFSILTLSFLLSLATATAHIPRSDGGSGSSKCAALPVLDSCLASTEAIRDACATTDYNCLCDKSKDVTTYVSTSPTRFYTIKEKELEKLTPFNLQQML